MPHHPVTNGDTRAVLQKKNMIGKPRIFFFSVKQHECLLMSQESVTFSLYARQTADN